MAGVPWSFENNNYLTTNDNTFNTRISSPDDPPLPDPVEVLELEDWQTTYNLDNTSTADHNTNFNEVLHMSVTQNFHKPSRFKVVISSFEQSDEKVVTFLSYATQLLNTPYYEIRDVEDYNVVYKTGMIDSNNSTSYSIKFDTNLPDFAHPEGFYSGTAEKTNKYFGVFEVNFSACESHIILDGVEDSTTSYQAEYTITCAGDPPNYIIENTADVTLRAGQSVTLLPGFKTELGAKFHAKIEQCPTNTTYNDNIPDGIEYQHSYSARMSSTINDTNLKEEIVKVHPNPTEDVINITSTEVMTNFELLDQLGSIHQSGTITSKSSNQIRVSLKNLSAGLYFLKVTLTTGKIITKQVIKK